ncbi:hypothetical protein O1L55_36315 [Streptomyces albulus]|nr:hypothetical protein [Streptomyces noursei]
MILRLVSFGHDFPTEDHQGISVVFNGMQGLAAAVGGRAVQRSLCPALEIARSDERGSADGPDAS